MLADEKKQKIVNIVIQVVSILLTLVLLAVMLLNAPIIAYHAEDNSIRQLSVVRYLKAKKPVQYLEGSISRPDSSEIELNSDVDADFNDGLDLDQTIEGQFTILFLGFDTPTNGSGHLHDVNYLIQFNLRTASMNILQIPRDTYVAEYAGYSTAPTYKFNSLYVCGDPELSRIQRVVNCVQDSFGVPVDAYVTTTCDNVVKIVDIIGGIPINMPYTIQFEPGKVIYEGEQTLNGEQSEWLLRFRRGYQLADIGRIQAQRMFLAAAMKKAISMGNIKVFQAANQIYDEELIGTDLSLEDIARIADLAGTIEMKNVNVFMLPGESAMINGQACWSVHKGVALDILNTYFRTMQVPLERDQSAIMEYIPEGSYKDTTFDDTAATLQDVHDGTVEPPKLK